MQKIKILFLSLLLLACCALPAYAQTINDVPLKDADIDYVEIVGMNKAFSSKLIVIIDFGQENKVFKPNKESVLKDETGKPISFNSMVDALNFMSKNGFEFVTAYTVTVSNQNVYHYLLRKKK